MELQFQEYLNQKVTAAYRKTILITGANSGIGYQATRMLIYKGAHVLMACRDKEKAEKARKELLKENKDALIDILIYDQASLKTIDELKKEILDKGYHIDCFILNAAVLYMKDGLKTKEGYSLTLGTNFIGTAYFYETFKDYFLEHKSRVVFINSIASRFGVIKEPLLKLAYTDKEGHQTYNRSKRYLQYFQNLVTERDKDIEIVAAAPGVCGTNILKSKDTSLKPGFAQLGSGFMNIMGNTPEKSALCLVRAALDPVVNRGDYFVPRSLFHIKGFPRIIKTPNPKPKWNTLDELRDLLN